MAGVEAAWALANGGFRVRLFEAKPNWFSPAHKSENFAELVCSNSLKSEEEGHATALLKEEMRVLGSLVMQAADVSRVPAGKALAVDRDEFSKYITEKINSNPNIEVVKEEVKSIDEARVTNHKSRTTIIATGPLTSPSLTESLQQLLVMSTSVCHSRACPPAVWRESGNLVSFAVRDSCLRRNDRPLLYFYDAIAPIVEAETINMEAAFRASRYGVGRREEGDYLNCPLTKDEYYCFVEALLKAEKIRPHGFEEIRCFEGCQPIEVIAEGHKDSLRHGPMKPMGLVDPRTGARPYAVAQLRQDNLHATLFNIVGFQTRMTYPFQDMVLRMIPALKCAKFARYGSMHRNTYLNGPALLDEALQLQNHHGIYMAGQLTGVEGYLESAATGLYAGLCAACPIKSIPPTTAIGALIHHVTHADPNNYQPMKMMWGIFPPLKDYPSTSRGPKKDIRKGLYLSRARRDFKEWFLGCLIACHVL